MAVSSVADLEPVAQITARLQALLDKAKGVKPETTIEPPLPNTDLIPDIDGLHDGFADQVDQALRYSMTDYAARNIFYPLVDGVDIDDPSFVQVWNLLDILVLCSDRERCAPEILMYLIEELLDSQTTDGCRRVFDYLESRGQRMFAKDFHKKNFTLLRACNELLRRLSRAEDAIFCGRVFFFLFQTFPLGDRSSVNLRGEFHVENTTAFEVPQSTGDQFDEKMELDEAATKIEKQAQEAQASTPQPPTKPAGKAVPPKPTKKVPEEVVLANSDLYPIFWRLQQYFSNPIRLFEPGNFAVFRKGLGYTLTKFRKTPTVVQTKPVEDSHGTKRKLGEDGNTAPTAEQSADIYNPKYLTSQDLFDLELGDLAFQRHIMVQALILIDFLLTLTEKAKKKLEPVILEMQGKHNKALVQPHTLGEEDAQWAASTRTAITTYLQSTTDGRFYHRMVETVLARDKNWARWKLVNCPSILREPVSLEQEMEARAGARGATKVRRLPARPPGAMDLSFLVDGQGGGLEALKKPQRFTAPSLDDLVDGVRTDKLDLEMAMDDEEKASLTNAVDNKTWRALRHVRATELDKLDKFDPSKDLEETLMHQPSAGDAPDQQIQNEGGPTPESMLTDGAPQNEDSTTQEADVMVSTVTIGEIATGTDHTSSGKN